MLKKMFKLLLFIVVLLSSFSKPLLCGKKKNGSQKNQRPECQYCGKSFSDNHSLKRHVRDNCKKSPDAENRQRYLCQYCGKSLSDKGYLKRHIRDVCKEKETGIVLGKRKRTGVKLCISFLLNPIEDNVINGEEIVREFKRRKLLHENTDQ